MWRRLPGIVAVILLLVEPTSITNQTSELNIGRYDNSLIVAPHYVEFISDSDERFAHQAMELKRRLRSAPHVLVGFAASLPIQIPAVRLEQRLTEHNMTPAFDAIDRIIERARSNNVVVHITLTSGFFHGMNELRPAAIQQDVRNAQWFSDGWIAEPASLTGISPDSVPSTVWITPSRYAKPLRARMEESVRLVGSRLAAAEVGYTSWSSR